MRNIPLAMALSLALVFGAAACGDDDTDTSEVRTELVDVLGLTDEQADCVIDNMGDRASVILEVGDPDFEPSEDDLVALDRAGDECSLE